MIGLLLGLLLAVFFVGLHDWQPSRLVHAGPPFTDRQLAPETLYVGDAADAFDGQFYYRMTRGPFATSTAVDGVRFDLPALRSARLGYPLLAWLLSGGTARLAPFALIAVNVTAFGILAWLGAVLASMSGRHASWGLLLVAYPGFVYTIAFDLAELTVASFIVGAIVAHRHQRFLLAGSLFAAALVTKESAFVVVGSYCLAWLIQRLRSDSAEPATVRSLGALAIPLVVVTAWQLVGREWWGEFPLLSSSGKNMRVPFTGLAQVWSRFWPPTSADNLFRLAMVLFLAAVTLGAGMVVRASSARLAEKLAWGFAAVLATMMSEFPFAGATSFMRGTTELYLLSVIVVLGADVPRSAQLRSAFAVGSTGAFALTVVAEASKVS